MDISIFHEKEQKPGNKDLVSALGNTFAFWNELRDFVFEKYPKASEEWNFPGKKDGWGYRIKDKKRAIIYLLPREGFFKVALVLEEKQWHRFWKVLFLNK